MRPFTNSLVLLENGGLSKYWYRYIKSWWQLFVLNKELVPKNLRTGLVHAFNNIFFSFDKFFYHPEYHLRKFCCTCDTHAWWSSISLCFLLSWAQTYNQFCVSKACICLWQMMSGNTSFSVLCTLERYVSRTLMIRQFRNSKDTIT